MQKATVQILHAMKSGSFSLQGLCNWAALCDLRILADLAVLYPKCWNTCKTGCPINYHPNFIEFNKTNAKVTLWMPPLFGGTQVFSSSFGSLLFGFQAKKQLNEGAHHLSLVLHV